MSSASARGPVPVLAGGREHPLPSPVLPCVRIFPRDGSGKLDPPLVAADVSVVLHADPFEMVAQIALDAVREHRQAIVSSLSLSHQDLVSREVYVLDPKPDTFHQA